MAYFRVNFTFTFTVRTTWNVPRARACVCVCVCEVHRLAHNSIRLEMNVGTSGELATSRCCESRMTRRFWLEVCKVTWTGRESLLLLFCRRQMTARAGYTDRVTASLCGCICLRADTLCDPRVSGQVQAYSAFLTHDTVLFGRLVAIVLCRGKV